MKHLIKLNILNFILIEEITDREVNASDRENLQVKI